MKVQHKGKKDKGTQCSLCPRLIFKKNESRGIIFLIDGKPVCAVCRIKRGKSWSQIEADKPQYEKEIEEKENKRVREVGYRSQVETQTDFIKKKTN
jgi:hypothetical protein